MSDTRLPLRAAPEPDVSAYEQAMDEWVALFSSRDDMAWEYARHLRELPATWGRWADFNAAILRRWSPAGLRYIKEKAWKLSQREALGA